MSSADHRRRTRRIVLLLSAILIPTAAVILLGSRVLRQEKELSDRRAAERQRESVDQLRRELTARLQALRLEEVNRIIGDSGRRLPPDSPVVFVAPMVQGRMVPPWEDSQERPPRPTAEFTRLQREGESQEFRQNDPAAAADTYRHALEVARGWERCSARIWLGRSYRKAGKMPEADQIDHDALRDCGELSDGDGVPLALYAAERLLANSKSNALAADYVVHRANAPQSRCEDSSVFTRAPADRCSRRWRSPNEAFILKSLLQRIGGAGVNEPLRALEGEIRSNTQIAMLVQDPEDHLGKLQQASRPAPGDLSWVGYGEEPWLLTLVSPTSFAPPLVLAVSSRRVLPMGVTLRVAPTDGAVPLGDGFVDLYAHWPPGHFADPSSAPGALYGSMLAMVLGAALLAGYLLLRDVQRETETAAMRSNFVASVSHELKTPLTSIRAHAETLLLGRAPARETTTDYLRTIVNESERLTRLVESVLDFSRIEQGRKTYQLQETPLDEVVRSAAKAMEYPLSQLGFALTISSDGTAPIVSADREALAQAILNLLGNAMKYSGDARNIEMRFGTRNSDAFVDIVDHGIGIAPTDQARIFERFHRVQSVETTGIAGTGLGLTLALHVVEAHCGRIAVVSQPGLGSTFSVCIPLQAHTT